MQRISKERKLEAVNRYIAGENAEEIAGEYGRRPSTIKSWAKEMGKTKQPKVTEEEKKQVCRDYLKGYPIKEIAEKYSRSTSAVRKWIRGRGIFIDRRVKPRWEPEPQKPKKKRYLCFIRTGACAGYWGYKTETARE